MVWEYVYLATFTSGIGFNMLELVFLVREKKIKEPFKMAIFSLALADLLSSSIMMLLAMLYTIAGKYKISLFSVAFASFISSQFHIIFITIQRFVAVIYPLKLKIVVTSLRSAVSLVFIWISSISLAIVLKNINLEGFIGVLILGYVSLISGVVIIFSYGIIIYRLIKQRMKITPNTSSPHKLRTILYSLTITAAFIVCNYPWVLTSIKRGACKSCEIPFNIESVLLWLNLVIDPIIYFLFHAIKSSNAFCNCT